MAVSRKRIGAESLCRSGRKQEQVRARRKRALQVQEGLRRSRCENTCSPRQLLMLQMKNEGRQPFVARLFSKSSISLPVFSICTLRNFSTSAIFFSRHSSRIFL